MNFKKLVCLLLGAIIFTTGTFYYSPNVYAYSKPSLLEDNTIYYIKNKNSGKYLDVDHSIDKNGTNVLQWHYNGGVGQQWKLVHTGNGLYKLVSQVGSKNRVLDINKNDNKNRSNIDIWTDNNSGDRRFRIIMNEDGYSYRIVSQCSKFTKAVTVEKASCNDTANVFQFQYNASNNDEWIFEPVNGYSRELATNYATKNVYSSVPAYPNLRNMGGDCANFVSQCMLAGGIHYQDNWYIQKDDNKNPSPLNVNQLDASWRLADPSPWISAKQFNLFWSKKYQTETVTGKFITEHPDIIFNAPTYKGDIIQIAGKNFWGGVGAAKHTMIITNYGFDNGPNTFELSYHSSNKKNKSLLEIAKENPDDYFIVYSIK
ncbi:MAG: RICIN domain-containing protein [Pseudoruminococcus massiliensis]